MTTPHAFPEQLLKQTAWLQRLTRQLVADPHTADDLLQDTLAAALGSDRPTRAHVRTWLERIARNLAAGGTRARFRRLRRERQAAAGSDVPATADTIAQFELHRSVVDAVEQLREPIRSTLLLRFWEDLPPREIARRMGAPVETVRTRIKRGLRELRGGLDARHGRREAWSVPLVAMSSGQLAAAAPPALLAFSIASVMKLKTLALGAVALFGIAAAVAWSLREGSPGGPPERSQAGDSAAAAADVAAAGQAGSPSADGSRRAREPLDPDREAAIADARGGGAWVAGIVTDELSTPLADVEVALMTAAQADSYRRYTDSELSAEELHFERVRWTLWHVSDKGLMRNEAILGAVFGDVLVARTDQLGAFRLSREAVGERTVAAVWSPTIGLRFQAFESLREPLRIACERWPSIRVEVAIPGGQPRAIEVEVDTGIQEPPRVLAFRPEAPGVFETPQLPPGAQHVIQIRAPGHQLERQQFDLFVDTTIRAKLAPHARLRARLLDTAGNLLDRQGWVALGWQPDELAFVLLRDDFQNDAELALDNRVHSVIQYSGDDAMLDGPVEDPQARVLSIWRGKERVAAVRLPNHRVTEVAVGVGMPRTPATLEVDVSFEAQTVPPASVDLGVGNIVGLAAYSFALATKTSGPPGMLQIAVPSYLRGQTARLIVRGQGFATQLVDVSVPLVGDPQSVRVRMTSAPHTLRGVVLDEHGKPLRDAHVKIATAEGKVFRPQWESIQRTDDAGAFAFEGFAQRDVRLFVQRRGYAATAVVASTGGSGAVTIRMAPGTERTVELGPNDHPGFMLRVLNVLGEPLLDDHVFGAVHGRMMRIHLSSEAHTLEAWLPGATEPLRTIRL